QVSKNRARRTTGERRLVAAESGEVGDAEVATEADARALGLEVVRRAIRRDERAPRVSAVLTRQWLARAYLHVQRQYEDHVRKLAGALISSCDWIAYESLQIRNRMRNHTLAK